LHQRELLKFPLLLLAVVLEVVALLVLIGEEWAWAVALDIKITIQ
jgi:hypothetical protein